MLTLSLLLLKILISSGIFFLIRVSNTCRFNIIIFKHVCTLKQSNLEFGKVKLRRTIQLKGHRMSRGENIWEEKISPVGDKVKNQKRKKEKVGEPDR